MEDERRETRASPPIGPPAPRPVQLNFVMPIRCQWVPLGALALLGACASAMPAPEPAGERSLAIRYTDSRDTFALELSSSLSLNPHFSPIPVDADPVAILQRGEAVIIRDQSLVDALPPAFEGTPLAWDRTLVLFTHSGAPLPLPLDSSSLRRDLLGVSTAAASRIAERPFVWESSLGCGASSTPPVTPQARIVYPARDSTAALLAFRIAALTGYVALPLERRELGYALADGRAAGAILDFVRHPDAEWPVPTIFCAARSLALIDTHAWLVEQHPRR